MNALLDNHSKSSRHVSILFLVITAVLWSLGGLLIKMVNWNPVAIAGMRSAIASVLLLAVIRRPKFNWSFPQIGGAVAYAATVTLFVTANKLTTASNAILLQYTAPIYVALIGAWLLKEKCTKLDWLTVFLVLGGMFLFFIDGLTPQGLAGNLIAILSGVSFAWLAIFIRMQKDGSSLESILLGNILAALIGLPFMFQSAPDARGWLGLTLLGVFQLGLAYIFYTKAMKNVTALEGILIPVIEPILNPVWVLLAVGEVPGSWALAGGAVVLAAVTFRSLMPVLRQPQTKKSTGAAVD